METNNFQRKKIDFNQQQLEQIYQQSQEKLETKKDFSEKKEIIKEVVEEKIKQSTSSQTAAVLKPEEERGVLLKSSEIKRLPEEKRVEALVKIALKDSIEKSVKIAQKLGPYYVDELHDTLVDKFLAILIQQKKF